MDLILWRHADARDGEDELLGQDLPLTPKGERQAQRMAQWLNRNLPDSSRVLVSPALCTRQTADALNTKYKLMPELAADRSPTEMLEAVRWPDARMPVVVVGHQPTLGLAAAYLMEGSTRPWVLRKGAICWLRKRERLGRGEVLIQAVLAPDHI